MTETYIMNDVTIQLLGKKNGGVHPDAIYLMQEHGTMIQELPTESLLKGDGIFFKKGTGKYAVKFADCLCVAIVGKTYVSFIHIGRRGLYQGLMHHAVQKMCRHGELVIDMEVLFSPCIKFLEVGRDGSDFSHIVPRDFLVKNNQGYNEIDIVGRATSQSSFQGIQKEQIIIHPDCTLNIPSKRYSYRKDGTSKRNWMVV